jgi:ABC-type cobalamin transport system permease subunit
LQGVVNRITMASTRCLLYDHLRRLLDKDACRALLPSAARSGASHFLHEDVVQKVLQHETLRVFVCCIKVLQVLDAAYMASKHGATLPASLGRSHASH